MITAVSLNPSIDKALTIERFRYGSMNQVMSTRRDAGEKPSTCRWWLPPWGRDPVCGLFVPGKWQDH